LFYEGVGLGVNSVGTDNIQDGAITTAKISDSAITTSKIADDSITGAKILLLNGQGNGLRVKNASGTAVEILYLGASNNLEIGSTTYTTIYGGLGNVYWRITAGSIYTNLTYLYVMSLT